MKYNINAISKKLLEAVADFTGTFKGAFHIWENGKCAGTRSTEHVHIEAKGDQPGINVIVEPGTKGETVYIPACITNSGLDDKVYNDFYVGKDADVVIVAGCGVHSDDHSQTRHSGVHRFVIDENAHVRYEEKHIGIGVSDGERVIDPVADIELNKNAYLEMNTTQISGIQHTKRKTTAKVAEGAKLVVRERLFTEGDQKAESTFYVSLDGEDSGADIVSRSVAKDHSYQYYESTILGNAPCTGHSECDSIIDDEAIVDASPRLFARNKNAALIHEAAIGKIAGDQILKFRTLGLTEEEAEAKIIEGFLS